MKQGNSYVGRSGDLTCSAERTAQVIKLVDALIIWEGQPWTWTSGVFFFFIFCELLQGPLQGV
jgi:hypothetical protein